MIDKFGCEDIVSVGLRLGSENLRDFYAKEPTVLTGSDTPVCTVEQRDPSKDWELSCKVVWAEDPKVVGKTLKEALKVMGYCRKTFVYYEKNMRWIKNKLNQG